MSKLPQKFQSKTSFQALNKKKTKHLVFIYLVTQNHLYSKNFQQMPNILWFYCIDLNTRIPKHQSLYFSEFPMNFYGISISLQKLQRSPWRYYSYESTAIQITPWGFDSSQLEALGRVREGEAVVDRPNPSEGLTGGEG